MVLSRLKEWQESSGYLGTYAPDAPSRFTEAPTARTWDLWVHANLLMGLLEVRDADGLGLDMAISIGELLLQTFQEASPSPLLQGNHSGLSSAVLIEPLVRLAEATGDSRYLDFSFRLIRNAEELGLPLMSGAETSSRVTEVGTGKIYQLLWVLTGVAAFGSATDNQACIETAKHFWQEVHDHHLTPYGGPWGGVATHKEVFNPDEFFSPYGMVETCSSMAWMSLSKELLAISGEAKYRDAIQLTLFNAILGAQDINGRDWAYFTFPNGPRHNTYHWACCRSSGAMALEIGASVLGSEDPSTEEPVRAALRSQTLDHHGQEVFRLDYVSFSQGPYSLAAENEQGDLAEGTLRLPRLNPTAHIIQTPEGFVLAAPGRKPIALKPYADLAQASGAWRRTWFQVAWQ